MATYTGTILNITVTEDFCCVQIQTPTPSPFVLLWSFFVNDDTREQRFLNSYYLSLARDAFREGRSVTVFTTDIDGDLTALATSIRIE